MDDPGFRDVSNYAWVRTIVSPFQGAVPVIARQRRMVYVMGKERYFQIVVIGPESENVVVLALRELEAIAFTRAFNAHAEMSRAEMRELDLVALAAVPAQPVSLAMRMAKASDLSA